MKMNNFDFYSGMETLQHNEDTGLLEGEVGVLVSHINEQNKELFWANCQLKVAVNQDFVYPARVYTMDTVSIKIGGAFSNYNPSTSEPGPVVTGNPIYNEDMVALRAALSKAVDKEMMRRLKKGVYVDNAGFKDDTENMMVTGKIFAYIDNAGEVDGDVYGLSINHSVEARYNKRGFIEIWEMDVIEARRVFNDSDRKDEFVKHEWVGEERGTVSRLIKEAIKEFIEDNDNIIRVENDESEYEHLMWEVTDSQFDMKRWANAWSNEKNIKKGTALLTLARERLRIEILNDTKRKKDRSDYVEVKCMVAYGQYPLNEVLVQAKPTLKSINEAIEYGIRCLDYSVEVTKEQERAAMHSRK